MARMSYLPDDGHGGGAGGGEDRPGPNLSELLNERLCARNSNTKFVRTLRSSFQVCSSFEVRSKYT